MTGGFELTEPPPSPSPRSAVRKATFITVAGVLAIIGALVSGYYFAIRPVTLKVAVGPANSDDVRVVQALTQAFQDVFFLISALFAAALLIVPFCKTIILTDSAPIEAH